MPADCGLRGIAFVCVMQSHERDCSLDSASVLVGGVDDVGEHLGVGVAGAGDGIHTGEGETANHGILERHNHYLSFAHRRERLCDCCLSFVVMGSVANLIGLPDRSRWLSERSCWLR
ncbi:hypothetical protein DWY82_04415 [Bifidobacterium longum]|nr:hypothetical protein DWY82_04415 [Bifidobacterium longum]